MTRLERFIAEGFTKAHERISAVQAVIALMSVREKGGVFIEMPLAEQIEACAQAAEAEGRSGAYVQALRETAAQVSRVSSDPSLPVPPG